MSASDGEHQQDNLKLLIIEDNHGDYVFLCELLEEINARAKIEHWGFFDVGKFETVWVKTLAGAHNSLIQDNNYDAILLDLSLPDSEGLESLARIRAETLDTPVIVLSGHSRAELTFEAVTRGAQDFLVKGQFDADQLARSVRYAIEQKRIERQLDQASRHKSQFLANMSHELRTPITSILGFAEIVQAELANHPTLARPIDAVVRNTQHLLALLDDILDHSKIEAGKLVLEKIEVSIEEIIRQACSMIELQCKEKGLEFEISGKRPVPRQIVTDPLRLRQILGNLLTNAVKFTSKGKISLNFDFDPAGNELIVRVQDTGIGISDEKKKVLFQPFTQADPSNARQFGGSGLGLSITRHLVSMLGGKVELQSEPGEGSLFAVTLPIEGRDLMPIDEILKYGERTDLGSRSFDARFCGKVLLVEDTYDSRELIRLILSRSGIDVTSAASADDAIALALKGNFDIIFMDMHMPHLDGYQATRLLREKGYSGAIVALTARVTDDARAACIEAGCNDYLSKPIKRADFFEVLEKFLSKDKTYVPIQIANSEETDVELQNIIDAYRKDLPAKLESMVQAYERRNWKDLKNEAHKLANAEMFGFPQLTDIARKLEISALQGSDQECRNLLDSLRSRIQASTQD